MNFHIQPKIKIFILIASLGACFTGLVVGENLTRTCTIFTAAHGGTVLFGNNEDWHSPNPVIGFYPGSPAGYGSVHVGFRHRDGAIEFGGAMNDQGLAWDVNGLPRAELNPHPEKPYSHEADNYLSTITRKAATVEEAIRLAHEFDFGEALSIQIHIADASGDAVVISAGPDGEVAYTRKEAGDGYLVSTNFNLANPANGTVGWRYDTAVSMLEELDAAQDLTSEFAGSILDAVHLETLTSYTLYSNIFDLTNKTIYLYYMAQFDEGVELSLAEELGKGQRIVEMRDLFTPGTAAAGQAAYRRFEARFFGTIVAVVITILVVVAAGAWFAIKRLKEREGQNTVTAVDPTSGSGLKEVTI